MVISLKHNCYFFLQISYYPPTHPGQKNSALSLNLCRPHRLYRALKILAMMLQETLETIWACKLRKENLDALYTKLGGGEGGLSEWHWLFL